MNTDTLSEKQARTLVPLKTPGASSLPDFPSGPLSSFCNNPLGLEAYLDRRILGFHKALPKRFVRFLSVNEYPRTIGDLLEFDAGKLMKSRGMGITTLNQVVQFLNNIPELVAIFDENTSPGFFIGPDIRSCFPDHQSLFAGLGHLEIRWFECLLPLKFISYLHSHPELVTVKDILDINTKKLLRKNQVGKTTLKQLLDFLGRLPEINSSITNNRNPELTDEPYGNIEIRMILQDDDRFYLYGILEIHYGLISNFMSLLPERDRVVLQRRFAGRKTFQEIAEEYGLSRQRILLIVQHHTEMLKKPLSIFETRFKKYVVQMLYEMDGFIDDMLYPEDTGSILFVNILSYIYPSIPTRANSLTIRMIWNNKYFAAMKRRLMEQEIVPYQCTFKKLCQSMAITDADDAMNLYRIILCGHGIGFAVKDGVVYVVKTGRFGGD